jgi:uncharacterized surface protein with fasciclin (FAS1) repeats
MSFKKVMFYLFAFFLLFFSACKHDELVVYKESDNYSNAADFVKNNYNFTLLYAALKQANLLELLSKEGPYTLFAPSNKAFNDLGIVRASDFAAMNQDSLRRMLQYHILPRILYRNDVPANTIDNKYINLAGKELFVGYKYEKACATCNITGDIYVNGALAPKTTQNIVLSYGVLHLIDKVLKYQPTVQDILSGRKEYSLFVTLLKRTGDWDRLARPDYTTVFAPDNQAFEKEGITKQQLESLDPAAYYKRLWRVYLLNNHFFISDMIIYGKQAGSGYYGGPLYRAPIAGDEDYLFAIASNPEMEPFIVEKRLIDGGIPLRKTNLQPGYRTDYKADNGVVHGITGLLVLPAEAKIN